MKKIKVFLGILSMICCMNFSIGTVNAKESRNTEELYIGNAQIDPRGAYLQKGISRISKVGSGLVRASGSTDAHRTTTVSVYVRLERKVGGTWQVYASWGEQKTGTSITSYRDFSVPKGYYYRVSCSRYAGPDTSSSYTEGMFID